jgi:hypothetical protein
MRLLKVGVVGLSAAGMLACGGSEVGQLETPLLEKGVEMQDAIYVVNRAHGGVLGVTLFMSSKPGLCDAFRAGHAQANATMLVISLGGTGQSPFEEQPVADYAVAFAPAGGRSASASVSVSGPDCQGTLSGEQASARTGVVRVSALEVPELDATTAERMVGTFELTLGPEGVPAKGRFNAAHCGVPPPLRVTCRE